MFSPRYIYGSCFKGAFSTALLVSAMFIGGSGFARPAHAAAPVEGQSADLTPTQGEEMIRKIEAGDNFQSLQDFISFTRSKGWDKHTTYRLLSEQLANEPKYSRRWFLLKICWSQLALAVTTGNDGLTGYTELLGNSQLAIQAHAGEEFGHGLRWFSYLSSREPVTGFGSLYDYQEAKALIPKAVTDQLTLLKAGITSGVRANWSDLVAGRSKDILTPIVLPLLDDPQLQRNVPLSCFAGQLLLPFDIPKALAVLDAVRPAISKQNADVKIGFYRASEVANERCTRLHTAACDQRELVTLTNRGRVDLIRLLSSTGDKAGLLSLIDDFKAPMPRSEKSLCFTILLVGTPAPLSPAEVSVAVLQALTTRLKLLKPGQTNEILEARWDLSSAYLLLKDDANALGQLQAMEDVIKQTDPGSLPDFCKFVPQRKAEIQQNLPTTAPKSQP